MLPLLNISPSLPYLFFQTFRLSATSWGGFALMGACHALFVEKEKRISEEAYADAVALAWLMPGPVANNVVIKLGALMRGAPGAIVMGIAAVLPFFFAMCVMAVSYGLLSSHSDAMAALVAGLTPAACAVILSAARGQAKSLVHSGRDALLALSTLAAFLSLRGAFAPLLIMCAAAFAGWLLYSHQAHEKGAQQQNTSRSAASIMLAMLGLILMLHWVPSLIPEGRSATAILATFASVSLTLFGGGLIVIPILDEMLVRSLGWIDPTAFYTAIASAQVVPGPLLSSVSFIGYHINGLPGAVAATLGMFVPPAIMMLAAAGIVARLSRHGWFTACMRGTRVAVVGLTMAAGLSIGAAAIPHWISVAIFALAFVLLRRFRIPAALVVPAAGLAGLAIFGNTGLLA